MNLSINKRQEKGKTAILISPAFGGGWSTETSNNKLREAALFDSRLIEAVENGDQQAFAYRVAEINAAFADKSPLRIGLLDERELNNLQIEWVDQPFYVREYDGAEMLILEEQLISP
jgi:hypothetical protein